RGEALVLRGPRPWFRCWDGQTCRIRPQQISRPILNKEKPDCKEERSKKEQFAPPSQTTQLAHVFVGRRIVWTSVAGTAIVPGMSPRRQTRRSGRFDSLEQKVFLGLWRTYDRLRAVEEELFARVDLTPQQYNALRLLRSERPKKVPTLRLAARL